MATVTHHRGVCGLLLDHPEHESSSAYRYLYFPLHMSCLIVATEPTIFHRSSSRTITMLSPLAVGTIRVAGQTTWAEAVCCHLGRSSHRWVLQGISQRNSPMTRRADPCRSSLIGLASASRCCTSIVLHRSFKAASEFEQV